MSTSATTILAALRDHQLRVFTTADVITLLSARASAASQALRRLHHQKLVTKIRRNLWVNAMVVDLHPYELLSSLTAPWSSYVSLQSALADHGLIAEIPSIVYGVTAGRAKRFHTPLGTFELHHLPNEYLWGYQAHRTGQGYYLLAEPEKAILDMAYLSLVRRTNLRFPPTRLGRRRIDRKKLLVYAKRYDHAGLLTFLKTRRWL